MVSHAVSVRESVDLDDPVFSEGNSTTSSTACMNCIISVIVQLIVNELSHDLSVEIKTVSSSDNEALLVCIRILKLYEDVLEVTLSVYLASWC